MTDTSPIQPAPDGVHLHVKAVAGASGDRVTGLLGSALKVRIAAPAEGGKANKAIRRLIADAMGVAQRDVAVASGQARARKVIVIRGLDAAVARQRLAALLEAGQ